MSPIERKPGFKITGGKGFHVTFPNGWTVSVQFGPGNYCDNYDADMLKFLEKKATRENWGEWKSSDAEVAVFDPQGEWRTREACKKALRMRIGDDVVGRISPDGVLAIMKWVAARNAS